MSAGSGAQERMLAELERLKERAGMSFAQLQSAVPYSRSALHRYFTGQAPIPRDALVSVVGACGGDVALLVRMWEAAQSDPVLGADPAVGPTGPARPVGPVGPVGPAGPGRPARPAGPMALAAHDNQMRPVAAVVSDGRIRATAPYVQSPDSQGQERGQGQPTQPSASPKSSEAPDASDPDPDPDPDPSETRQRAIRAWFALAFVIVAIMAVRPLIDATPQSSAATPVTSIEGQSQGSSQDPADDPANAAATSDGTAGGPVPSADRSSAAGARGTSPSTSTSASPAPSTVPAPSKAVPIANRTSQPPASPSRNASAPPEVTIVSDQDNGHILRLPSGSIVEVALTGAWAQIKVNTDGSLVRTTPPVAAPWARQIEAFVVGSSGVSTSFCAYPISRGFTTVPGSVCVFWPGSDPFNVTIVRA